MMMNSQKVENTSETSYRRKPVSSVFDNFLDPGFHRGDIFGTSLFLTFCEMVQE